MTCRPTFLLRQFVDAADEDFVHFGMGTFKGTTFGLFGASCCLAKRSGQVSGVERSPRDNADSMSIAIGDHFAFLGCYMLGISPDIDNTNRLTHLFAIQ